MEHLIIKQCYFKLLELYSKVRGLDKTKVFDARVRFKRNLNLKTPETLADKVCYLEIHQQHPLAAACTDKYEVRKYIKEKGLEDILVPIIGESYNHVDEIKWNKLPNQFVIKATHGCKMNLICEDKTKLNLKEAKKQLKKWLNMNYYAWIVEPHYKQIPHRLYCEELLENVQQMVDYKFYCFYGKPEFILVCSERTKSVKKNLYDLEWNPIDGLNGRQKNDKKIAKPAVLNQMEEIAKILSREFDFVRVDLYAIKNKIYFSELTFTPSSGIFANFTEEFIKEMGKKLTMK